MRSPFVSPSLVSLAILTVSRVASAQWPTTPLTAVAVCTAPGSQDVLASTPDGSGGAWIVWLDGRSGVEQDLYVSHVIGGAIASGIPANGLAVCTATGTPSNVQLVPGTAGDAYVVWDDPRSGTLDVYAQRVLANGTIASGWPANGLALTTDGRNQFGVRACGDGAGALYAVWVLEIAPGTDYDIYASRVLPGGTLGPNFVVNGLVINGAGQIQQAPDIAPDGFGNALICYEDLATVPSPNIWAQKLGPTGARSWGTTSAGVLASNSTTPQRSPRIAADGRGGCWIARDVIPGSGAYPMVADLNSSGLLLEARDLNVSGLHRVRGLVPDGVGGAWLSHQKDLGLIYESYVARLDASGNFTSLGAGLLLQAYLASNPQPSVTSPGDGSLIAAWLPTDQTGRPAAQRFDASQAAVWNGALAVSYVTVPGTQRFPALASDGSGGAIFAWSDDRAGNFDVYASRVDRFGALGDAAPKITRIADLPGDQGGSVSLQWTASYKDVGPSYSIARYSVWRRVPGGLASLRADEGAAVLRGGEARPARAGRIVREQPTATGVVYWEYVSVTPARGYAGYSAVVPTTSDSMPGSNPRTSFLIEAETASGIPFWDSAPDSGYSVDNLPPNPPAPFFGTYSSGVASLGWQASPEPDVASYRLYRGTSPSFVPSLANRVTERSGTSFADAVGAPYWYKLTAVDTHGNESAANLLLPSGTADASGPALPRELSLAAPAPNPARGGTTLRFALPRAGEHRLEVFDAAGRCVRVLESGSALAGEYVVRWDGRDDRGRALGAGLYFVRLSAGGSRLERRLALLL